MKKITELTKRDIFEALINGITISEKVEKIDYYERQYWEESTNISKMTCYGRFDEISFLKRIYSLETMPSNDARYKNAEEDIIQHTINNDDWDIDWVFFDERFGLKEGTDEQFLLFICEIFHPTVRNEKENWKSFLKHINELLIYDGYEICENDYISGRPVYSWNRLNASEKQIKKVVENFDKYFLSFVTWYNEELPFTNLLKEGYRYYDNFSCGHWIVDIDFEKLYKLKYGIEWENVFSKKDLMIDEFSKFLELLYEECTEDRYKFTVEINNRLQKFKIPYKLQNGKLTSIVYKSSFYIDKIINYELLEKKIQQSEELISSNETKNKKTALDLIVDSLQYLISISSSNSMKEKYKDISIQVGENKESKVYTVIRNELEEIMKISNEYFDIRHNDYLNSAKENREAIKDKIFIEYLYNRVYALTFIIRLKK